MKSGFFAAVAPCILLAAPVSAQGVKIGMLNDQPGGGKYSVEPSCWSDAGGELVGLTDAAK